VIPSAIGQFNDLGPSLTPLLDGAREWAQTIEPRALSGGLLGLIDTIGEVLVPTGTEVQSIPLSPDKPPAEITERVPDPDKP